MNGTGLTVANVTTLASKELTVELFNIMNAINEGNKSAWEIARAYKRIIDDELFDEDFDNVQEFALYVGVSKSAISQYIKIVFSELVHYLFMEPILDQLDSFLGELNSDFIFNFLV